MPAVRPRRRRDRAHRPRDRRAACAGEHRPVGRGRVSCARSTTSCTACSTRRTSTRCAPSSDGTAARRRAHARATNRSGATSTSCASCSTIRKAADLALRWAVFEPNDETHVAERARALGAILRVFFERGAFAGETPEAVVLRPLRREHQSARGARSAASSLALVGFQPAAPCEFIVIRVGRQYAAPAVLAVRGRRGGGGRMSLDDRGAIPLLRVQLPRQPDRLDALRRAPRLTSIVLQPLIANPLAGFTNAPASR